MKRRRTSRRKLPFFAALFPYLGGKRRLCPLIFREIDRLLPRRHWRDRTFLDGFLGGGSVSLYAKAVGFRGRQSFFGHSVRRVGPLSDPF